MDGANHDYDWVGDLGYLAEGLGRILKHGNGELPYSQYDGATIHLRCCYGETFADQVADASGLRTTGWTGEVHSAISGAPDYAPGADYYGSGDYVTYYPGYYLDSTMSAYEYYCVYPIKSKELHCPDYGY
jgi:hypothetical protein